MEEKKAAAGYDKFINWKLFAIPVVLFLFMALIPTPSSMLDVGVEYSMGQKYVEKFFAKELFGTKPIELSQWQIQMVRMMEASVQGSSFTRESFLKRGDKWCKENDIPFTKDHLELVMAHAKSMAKEDFNGLLKKGYELRAKDLKFDDLSDSDKVKAKKAGFHVQVAVGIVLFVVSCFVTEALPLPIVAFCVGILALATGIVNRHNVASSYWSDATWFIMGSLMFAAAFVKTGVDKRVAMMMFGKLKNANIKVITFVMILVIAPLTMFMSDHALAAMFLPIGILLYSASIAASDTEDPELAKMLMITIAMAANLGGSLSPSGAARNIIMMNYTEDMFGISIGFGTWCLYCMPFLLFVMPISWLVINWTFKPTITNLGSALQIVHREVNRDGGKWTKAQIISLIIFLITLLSWITESNLLVAITGIRFGIGALAVMGAVLYICAGVVNWRDYQTRVDWGVVWLYAGAIIFGKVLVQTGGAYWIARTLLEFAAPLGLDKGLGLLLTGSMITGLMTQIMADGPACAAVGPVTLAMAGIAHAGTSMIPMMAMATAIASSFAYCLVIGTPPNAIVYSSGYLNAKDFIRAGLILWVTNMIGLMLLATFYWRFMGWTGLPAY
ncbi:MAG: DASS family sodium-coupled anion symporter [Desulfobacterales bacterium]|nr:DASS family sodium-coupled anion symporter [Desulfobacterales bacterium]